MEILEAKRCTPWEYNILLEAKQLREADELLLIHRQAWAIQAVQATKRNGKSKYRNFEDFFNHEKMVARITGKEKIPQRKKGMADQNRRLSEFRKMRGMDKTERKGGTSDSR